MEFAASTVIMSVAALEGILNEMISGADDSLSNAGVARSTTQRAIDRRWARLWQRDVPGRGFNALEKVQILLEIADIDPLPTDHGSAQQLFALIRLRNELIHSEPTYEPHVPFGPQSNRGKLEKLLSGKFELSTVLPVTVPFVWARCLSAGCARWAVETEIAVRNDLNKALGVPITISAPWQSSGSR
jgi:hypothetical protein